MSIQSEFQAGAEEYARRLEERRETERLEALRLEARKQGNASAFAEFFEATLTQSDNDTDDTNQEIQ